MDQLYLLIFLSVAMLMGSFLSGIVPMAFKLSDSKSRHLALVGSGILVGTALAIIIPEGIDSIYGQSEPLAPNSSPKHQNSEVQTAPIRGSSDFAWIIGISLVTGFVLMLLIDQFSIYRSGDCHPSHGVDLTRTEYMLASQDDDADICLEEEDVVSNEVPSTTSSETRPIRDHDSHRIAMRGVQNNYSNQVYSDSGHLCQNHESRQPSRATNTKVTPTLGLVIHASADGIALGAAATTSHREVEMIIFLAIMLHKAPAAFSLVVFLLHRGLEHSTIRQHLLAFSLSAPIAALVTYFGLSQSGKEALRRNNATGIAMLFSAGTFLYVATVHVLPELVHNKLLTPKELMFLVGGAFLPILLAQSI